MDISSSSAFDLEIDSDKDGAIDSTMTAESSLFDVVKPQIFNLNVEQNSSLFSDTEFVINASFSDNSGGSGIDFQSIQIYIDDIDLTSEAELDEDSLSLLFVEDEIEMHTIRILVRDLDGNAIELKSVFSDDKDQQSATFSLDKILPYAIGGFLIIFIFVIIIVIVLVRRGKKSKPQLSKSIKSIQDEQGNWWYQDPSSNQWFLWDGKNWQAHTPSTPEIPDTNKTPKIQKKSRKLPFLLAIFFSMILCLVVASGISLAAFDMFPEIQLNIGIGAIAEILKMGGGGLLASILGFLLLNSGLKAIITCKVNIEDEIGRQKTKQGLGAIFYGLSQLFFGAILFIGGIGLLTLVIYQEVIPWLEF